MAEVKETKKKTTKKATKPEQVVVDKEEVVAEPAEAVVEKAKEAEETGEETKPAKATAKAGKRSEKALKEVAEKEAKQARKAAGPEASEKPKASVKPSRSRLERRGKNFRKSAETIDSKKLYNLDEAVSLAKKTSPVKFDASVELHINLSVDPKHADQNVRDNLVLPAGTGKQVRIAVLTTDAAEAKKAGADIAGTDELFAQLDKGNLNFDILIATPQLMAQLGKYARLLGPRGLMPNPKSGTVTTDLNKAIAEAKAGRVEYRVDTSGIVHLAIGKVSFTEANLTENINAVLTSIRNNKPQSVKGNYIKSVYLATSMGPSIKVDLANLV